MNLLISISYIPSDELDLYEKAILKAWDEKRHKANFRLG